MSAPAELTAIVDAPIDVMHVGYAVEQLVTRSPGSRDEWQRHVVLASLCGLCKLLGGNWKRVDRVALTQFVQRELMK